MNPDSRLVVIKGIELKYAAHWSELDVLSSQM